MNLQWPIYVLKNAYPEHERRNTLTCKPPYTARYQRHLFSVLLLFLSIILSDAPVQAEPSSQSQTRRQGDISYQDTTLTEDVTWRGTVLIRGYLVIAPQTTLRIEPGTVVQFASPAGSRLQSRLLVMGRIQAGGTADRPIHFISRQGKATKGSWGGIQLLNSEKRNQIEHCRIDGAECGIDSRFSSLTIKGLNVINSNSGILLRDSNAGISAATVTQCENGIEVYDSELELREASFSENRTGMQLARSSIAMSSVSVKGNLQKGIISDDCRIRINSCEVVGNAVGVQIKGGEGQLFMSRFARNRDTALNLSSARLKINRCRIIDNARDGMTVEDGRVIAWGNDFSGNGGYNLVHTGRETSGFSLNWWGSGDESAIMAKISISSGAQNASALNVYPWLSEKPAALP